MASVLNSCVAELVAFLQIAQLVDFFDSIARQIYGGLMIAVVACCPFFLQLPPTLRPLRASFNVIELSFILCTMEFTHKNDTQETEGK